MEMETLTLETVKTNCRTCLQKLPTAQRLGFERCYHLQQTAQLKDWLQELTPLRTLDEQQYPQTVCAECFSVLKRFHEFQNFVKRTAMLLDMLYEETRPDLVTVKEEAVEEEHTSDITDAETMQQLDPLADRAENVNQLTTIDVKDETETPMDLDSTEAGKTNQFNDPLADRAENQLSTIDVKDETETPMHLDSTEAGKTNQVNDPLAENKASDQVNAEIVDQFLTNEVKEETVPHMDLDNIAAETMQQSDSRLNYEEICRTSEFVAEDTISPPEIPRPQCAEINVQLAQAQHSEPTRNSDVIQKSTPAAEKQKWYKYIPNKPDKSLNLLSTHDRFKMLARRKDDSKFWTVYAEVQRVDGKILNNLVCCRICNLLLCWNGTQQVNKSLTLHKCYAAYRDVQKIQESPADSLKKLYTEAAECQTPTESILKFVNKLNTKAAECQAPTESIMKFEAEDTELTTTFLPDALPPNRLETPKELLNKILTGVYKILNRANNENTIWTVFGEIERDDRTVVDNFVYCRLCCLLLKLNGKDTMNLILHKCYAAELTEKDLSEISKKIESGLYKVAESNCKTDIWTVFRKVQSVDSSILKNVVYCSICSQLLKWNATTSCNLKTHTCYKAKLNDLLPKTSSADELQAKLMEIYNNITITKLYRIAEKKNNRLWTLFSKIIKNDGTFVENVVYCRKCCELRTYQPKLGNADLKRDKCYLSMVETHEEILEKISRGFYSIQRKRTKAKYIWQLYAHVYDENLFTIDDILYCRLCCKLFDYDHGNHLNLSTHKQLCTKEHITKQNQKRLACEERDEEEQRAAEISDSGGNVTCKLCNKYFKKNYIDAHMHLAHKLNNSFKCDLCPNTFDSNAQLQQHTFNHTCLFCGRKFSYIKGLKNHQLVCVNRNANLYYR